MKNRTKWAIYIAVPFVLSAVLQGMYFSGNLVLQRLVCPKLPPLNPDSYREFGLLENAQNLLLLAMLGIVIVGFFRSSHPRLRLAYGLLALFTAFVFLEEIDYGTHFYAFATSPAMVGWFEPATSPSFQAMLAQTDFTSEPFNIHNHGDLTDIIKAVVGVIILGLFVFAPFYEKRIRHPWVRYFLADRFALGTVLVMLVMRFVTRELGNIDDEIVSAAETSATPATREIGAMNNNLSEFRELLTYYLFLVYLGVLVFFRTEPAATGSAAADPDLT